MKRKKRAVLKWTRDEYENYWADTKNLGFWIFERIDEHSKERPFRMRVKGLAKHNMIIDVESVSDAKLLAEAIVSHKEK